MRSVLLSLVCFSLILGCDRGPVLSVKNAAPPQLEQGWKTLSTKDGAVSMGIPGYWKSATDKVGANEAFGAIFEQMEGQRPTDLQTEQAMSGVGEEFRQMAAESEREEEESRIKVWEKNGVLLMAFNNARPIPGEPRTAITLRRLKGEGRGTLDEAMARAKGGVLGEPELTILDFPIGPVGEIKSKHQTIAGDEICEIRYVILDGGDLYRLELITANGMKQIEDVARPVAQTIRIRPKQG